MIFVLFRFSSWLWIWKELLKRFRKVRRLKNIWFVIKNWRFRDGETWGKGKKKRKFSRHEPFMIPKSASTMIETAIRKGRPQNIIPNWMLNYYAIKHVNIFWMTVNRQSSNFLTRASIYELIGNLFNFLIFYVI